MVDITNGINTISVTKGAFEGIYKYQGYKITKDYAASTVIEQAQPEDADKNNYIDGDNVENNMVFDKTAGAEEPNFIEKPIGQWTKEELREYAEANDISLDGVGTVKEVRNIVKEHMDSLK